MDDQNQVSAEDGKDASMESSNMGDVSESSYCDTETETAFPIHEGSQQCMPKGDQSDIKTLGRFFEYCIQQVSHLEKQRDDLIQELISLQEPMLQAVEHLQKKLEEMQRLLTLAHLDYATVYEEVQQVRRKQFVAARECIQSQMKLAAQEYDVAQFFVTQEELEAHIQSLNQDLTQLQVSHQNQLNSHRAESSKPCRPRAMSDLSQCRQASIRLQRRLSGSMKTLESWYEPRLLALLKRRQFGEEALRNCREQAVDLKAKLDPLREDIQRLQLQRSSLEKRIDLMKTERDESVAHYKETVEELKETLRGLKTEFDVQTKSKATLEELTDNLATELRGVDESRNTTTEENQQFTQVKPDPSTSDTLC